MEPTIDDCLNQARQALCIQSDEAQIEAEHLLAAATGWSVSQLILSSERVLTSQAVQKFQAFLSRRLAGEPIAYIVGSKAFHDVSLQVNPDVLIPRGDTELVVELALDRIPAQKAYTVLDLGTGSGAIALSIAKQRARCTVTAVDVSQGACEVASGNAAQLQLDNVQVVCGDWFTPLRGQRFDLIVANPPYIAPNDPHLKQGDLRFEPQSALVAEHDGLACFLEIAAQARKFLAPQGSLLFEHGFDQGAALRRILTDNDFTHVETHRDLGGHERVTLGVSH